nr:N-acetyltransferase 10 [Ipomoea trifida]
MVVYWFEGLLIGGCELRLHLVLWLDWCFGRIGDPDGLVFRLEWCPLIATHPTAMKLGYGSAALELLTRLPPPGECDLYYVNRDTVFFSNHERVIFAGLVDESQNNLPDILCVIQVCLEGQILGESSIKSSFRCPRIATHPTAMKLGYGSAALQLLTR